MDTPSSRLLAAAQAAVETTDAQGRRLTLRRLSALDKLRLFKAAGPQLAQNPPWLGTALLAASVTAIDDIPIPAPTSEAQIEAIVQRLGDEGINAVSAALLPPAPALDASAAKN
jgi:hypothetical protein